MQQRKGRLRQLHPGSAEQRPGLIEREPEVGRADLGHLAFQPQAVQPEPHVMAGDEHAPQLRRGAHQQQFKLAQRLGRTQLVHIVDHQPRPVRQRLQVLQQSLDDRPAIQVRRRGQGPHHGGTGRGLLERAEHRDPEPLRIALFPMHRHPCRALGQARRADPGPQQERLPAPRRRRHLGDAPGSAEPLEQRAARYDPAPDRGDGCTGSGGRQVQEHGSRIGRGRSGRVRVWVHEHPVQASINP